MAALRALGAEPMVADVFDAPALSRAVVAAAPDVVIHQLTDLPSAPGTPGYEASLERNARLRIDGTRNLVAAAKEAGVRRLIAQSIAFVYAPGQGARLESDPLDLAATGACKRLVEGVAALEQATLSMPEGIVLRYGYLYGPGTWFEKEVRAKPALFVDAAAQAALLALSKGKPGVSTLRKTTVRCRARKHGANSALIRAFESNDKSWLVRGAPASETRRFWRLKPQGFCGPREEVAEREGFEPSIGL